MILKKMMFKISEVWCQKNKYDFGAQSYPVNIRRSKQPKHNHLIHFKKSQSENQPKTKSYQSKLSKHLKSLKQTNNTQNCQICLKIHTV